MDLSPLDIPEIRAIISLFLDKKDLLCCILVCREWRQSFEHRIYQDINFFNDSACQLPPLDRLLGTQQFQQCEKYSRYVRRLSLRHEEQFGYLKPTYDNLESFRFRWCFIAEDEEPVLPDYIEPIVVVEQRHHDQMIDFIRRHHSTLNEITVEEVEHGLPSNLWDLLAEDTLFPKLKALTVKEDMISQCDRPTAFWKSCSRVRKLELDGYQSDVPSGPQEWPDFNILESLTLHKTNGHSISHQVRLLPLISKCPQLKSLKWVLHRWYTWEDSIENDIDDPLATIGNIRIIEGLANIVSSARLPHLGSLDLTIHPYEGPIQPTRDILSTALAKLLSSLTAPLIRFHLLDFDLDPHLTFPSMQRHFATIKSLDISLTPSESSHMAQTIMSSCPSLEEFSGNVIRAVDMMQGAPWVCSKLERLSIIFEIDINNNTPGRTRKDQCHFVYRYLSRLSRLQSLNYRGRKSTLEETGIFSLSTVESANLPRYNMDLSFRPLIQGVQVLSSHFWNRDHTEPQGFEQNYDWYINSSKK